ncbi:MAG: hypothetical protein IJ890_05555 [Clostridia bacterium]|nr:hypothetical protein [Clostridia bacterium]
MKNKIAIYGLILTLLITIITTSLTFGRILERIDIIISRLAKIEMSLDKLHEHEKRIVILEEKVYNIEKIK